VSCPAEDTVAGVEPEGEGGVEAAGHPGFEVGELELLFDQSVEGGSLVGEPCESGEGVFGWVAHIKIHVSMLHCYRKI
jgi:hypothetical protein